jgi:hypothetical protein
MYLVRTIRSDGSWGDAFGGCYFESWAEADAAASRLQHAAVVCDPFTLDPVAAEEEGDGQ